MNYFYFRNKYILKFSFIIKNWNINIEKIIYKIISTTNYIHNYVILNHRKHKRIYFFKIGMSIYET